MGTSDRAVWDAAIVDLLDRAKRIQPDELAATLVEAVRPLGVRITLYLADLEQEYLRPVSGEGKPLPIDGSEAGGAFTTVTTVPGPDPDQVWVPMADGSDRLGVADVRTDRRPVDEPEFLRWCTTIIGLVGHLVAVKLPYGDALQLVRRSGPMTASAELIRAALPPLTFSHHKMVISAILEPCYDVGGDAFDYALDGPVARLLVLDAMGRGLQAALTSSTALAAVRATRRDARDLADQARAADAAVAGSFPDLRFVTGVLAELNLDTGLLRYLNAGHPAPLVLRAGGGVRILDGARRTPLGLPDDTAPIAEERLESGDRLLLYTDGVTEALDMDGARFGAERLAEIAGKAVAEGRPTPETLRRLAHRVRDQQGGEPADDATLLLFEWSAEAAARAVP